MLEQAIPTFGEGLEFGDRRQGGQLQPHVGWQLRHGLGVIVRLPGLQHRYREASLASTVVRVAVGEVALMGQPRVDVVRLQLGRQMTGR